MGWLLCFSLLCGWNCASHSDTKKLGQQQRIYPQVKLWADYEPTKEETDLSTTFRFHLDPPDDSATDVVQRGIHSLEDYRERMTILNFRLDEAFFISLGDQKIYPTIVHMENTYGLTSGRIIHVVFGDPAVRRAVQAGIDLDFVFDDPVFQTGINHFLFKHDAII